MKKLILTPILLFFLSINLSSQDRNVIGLTFGPNFPVGKYGKSDVAQSDIGYARLGYNFDFYYEHLFGNHLGMMLKFRTQNNQFNDGDIQTKVRQDFPSLNWSVQNTGYSNFCMMGGILLGYDLGSVVRFVPHGLIGVYFANSPNYILDGRDNSGNQLAYLQLNSKQVNSFTFLVGTEFQFKVGREVRILANLDYQDAFSKFSNVFLYTNSNSFNVNLAPAVSTFNLNVGIGLGF